MSDTIVPAHEKPPEAVELGGDQLAYKLELVRTLAHAFKINWHNNPGVLGAITREKVKATLEKFVASLQDVPLEMLEKRLAALQAQNPGLVFEAMKAAGHTLRVDKEGNIEVGDPTAGALGRPITMAEFEGL